MSWHDRNDSVEQLIRDAEEPDNPQGGGTPDSVRKSAVQELRNRGYSESDIRGISLGEYKSSRR